MPTAIFIPIFLICCCAIIVYGALQCFAPRKLKQFEDKFFYRHVNWSDSAGGAFIQKERQKQARRPSFLYRLSGLVMMGAGILMLFFALIKFIRW